MNDEYLWDRTGTDETVEALETLLRPAALSPARAPLPALPPCHGGGTRFPWFPTLMSAAAAIVLAVGLARPWPAEGRGWGRVAAPATEARTYDLGRYGEVRAEAGAVVHRLRLSDEEIRLRLERGTIHASITLEARPRLVQVETPATVCVDLGCHYTLSVDEDGATVVRVETGRVAFQNGRREVFVPAGATCRAEPGAGSGTPHWEDAPAALVAAIRAFDAAPSVRRIAAAEELCRAGARREDALTLWHLLQDDDRRVREAALAVLERVAGAPDGVRRESVLGADPGALEAWKLHLDLDPFAIR